MINSLFECCGLLATFLGALLEGEISMLTSIIGARSGYYNIYVAMILGFLGAWVADWFKFLVGKTKGQQLLKNKPKLQAKFDKMSVWFDAYPFLVLTFYKLFIGMTTIILLMAGVKGISVIRFAIHSALIVSLWVALLSGFGYYFAETMIMKFDQISMHKLEIVISLFLVAFLYWIFIKRPYQKACIECD